MFPAIKKIVAVTGPIGIGAGLKLSPWEIGKTIFRRPKAINIHIALFCKAICIIAYIGLRPSRRGPPYYVMHRSFG